jgi:hypothetical protein
MEDNNQSGYKKRPLWQWVAIYLVIGAILYGGVYYFILAKNKTTAQSLYGSNGQTSTPLATGSAGMVKFQDSPDYPNAYLIFPGELSSDAKTALTGFNMSTKMMTDGSTQVTLKAEESGYQDQVYIVKPGYNLYFIEKNLGDDDATANMDKNKADDSAVVVDPQGYII